MAEKVSDRVSNAIEKSPYSNAQIANKVGVSSTTVWRWREKKKETDNFNDRDLRALAEVLRVSYEWLQFGEGGMSDDPSIREIEQAVNEKGESYKGLDQTISDVELKANSLIQDLKALIGGLQKLRSDD